MRISDWSSDVCSSDLGRCGGRSERRGGLRYGRKGPWHRPHPRQLRGHLAGDEDCRQGICAASRSEEHTSELQSLMRISYAVFCLKKKNKLRAQYEHNEIL